MPIFAIGNLILRMAKDNEKYYPNTFPSPIADNATKNTKEYGLAVAKAINGTFIEGDSSYYSKRNAAIADNRMFANGDQPLKPYLDLMMIDGDQSFININFKARFVAPKFRDIMVNSIMDRNERIECKGLSLDLNQKKADKKADAKFRMENKDFIQDVQQQSGIQFEPDDAFTPESKEELDLWAELNDKEHEELLMEEGISFVMYNNDWKSIKKEIVTDTVETGFNFTKNYFDGSNRIRVKSIKPELMVYGTTHTNNFKGVSYIGHMERVSIVDVRCLFPKLSEKQLYDIAYSNRLVNNNGTSLERYIEDFDSCDSRPYDGYLIDILFFEYRVTKYFHYEKETDNNGKLHLKITKNPTTTQSETKTIHQQPLPTWYSGAWLMGSEIMADWCESKDLLRSREDKEDVRSSYTGYILNNSSGKMLPKSPIEPMKSSIMAMDLSVLKIQQHLAGPTLDGMLIDIDSIIDIDLGVGIGKTDAMKLRAIRSQTGDTYYSGKNIAGERNGRPPIEQSLHNMGDKIPQFMNVYNWEYQNIATYIGFNASTDGTSVGERMGAQVMQSQIKTTNTATAHLYGAYIYTFENTGKCVATRLWQTLKESDANSMYMKLLGKENSDFVKKRKDITSSNYDVMISVDMTDDDRAFLEANIERGLQAATIELEDAIYVRNQPNINTAIKYLSFKKVQRANSAQKLQLEQNQQMQTQNSQLAQQAATQKANEQKELDMLEIEKMSAKAQIEERAAKMKLVGDALLLSMKKDSNPIPAFIDNIMQNELQIIKSEQEQQLTEIEQEIEAELAEQEAQQVQEGEMQGGEMPQEAMEQAPQI